MSSALAECWRLTAGLHYRRAQRPGSVDEEADDPWVRRLTGRLNALFRQLSEAERDRLAQGAKLLWERDRFMLAEQAAGSPARGER